MMRLSIRRMKSLINFPSMAEAIYFCQFASEWYGKLVNTPSNFQSFIFLESQQQTLPAGTSRLYDTNSPSPFAPSPSSYPSTHSTINPTSTATLCNLSVASSSTIVPISTVVPTSTIVPAAIYTPLQLNALDGHPSIPEDFVACLRSAGAVSLVSLAMDMANFLWIHMLVNTLGRLPTDKLCDEIYIKVIQRRQ
ncbi:hypothetical protein JVT61DRAFT_4282 [Boletus reticuloceps]|uniref:Uncharacterized protein n=1 Tax=Boletus reticuloceps TaxID=495285 RepID=A0A8I2YLX9_9AGAM|nr:hypothetical protein JVT61DRAFT_4282 [Boletus reticuloceps]